MFVHISRECWAPCSLTQSTQTHHNPFYINFRFRIKKIILRVSNSRQQLKLQDQLTQMNVATQTKILYEGHPVMMTKCIKSCHHPNLQLHRPHILIIRLHFFRNANNPINFPTSLTQKLLGGFSKVKLHNHLPQDFLAETKTSRSSYISLILQMVTS
jgi:hypothetical protein